VAKLTARTADKHWLYEESVQNPPEEIRFINRVFKKEYGRKPCFLREDFCGTANLCSHWVRRRKKNTAMGIDLHGPTLQWGREHNLKPHGPAAKRVQLVQDDVRNVHGPACDVLAAQNFSWWTFKTRSELLAYLRHAHSCMKPEGLFLMDIYGGPEAQIPQIEEREQEGFTYVWDQDTFNPITHEIRCIIHFNFEDGSEIKRAFTYDWRLWTLPETRDLLAEAGFRKTLVYWEIADSDGEPSGIFRPSLKGDLAPAWVAYLVSFP
jgi:SAM-dependent methyltransferase